MAPDEGRGVPAINGRKEPCHDWELRVGATTVATIVAWV
jgi:hypothetical protein